MTTTEEEMRLLVRGALSVLDAMAATGKTWTPADIKAFHARFAHSAAPFSEVDR